MPDHRLQGMVCLMLVPSLLRVVDLLPDLVASYHTGEIVVFYAARVFKPYSGLFITCTSCERCPPKQQAPLCRLVLTEI
jgi:hypothetical protein